MKFSANLAVLIGACVFVLLQVIVSGAATSRACKSDMDCSEDECCVPDVLATSDRALNKRGGGGGRGISSFWKRTMVLDPAMGEYARGSCVSRRQPGQSCGGLASCPCAQGSSCHLTGRFSSKHTSDTGYCIFL